MCASTFQNDVFVHMRTHTHICKRSLSEAVCHAWLAGFTDCEPREALQREGGVKQQVVPSSRRGLGSPDMRVQS